jgi:hypothetical protein
LKIILEREFDPFYYPENIAAQNNLRQSFKHVLWRLFSCIRCRSVHHNDAAICDMHVIL